MVFAPTTKNEKMSGAFALNKSNFILRRLGCAVPTRQNMAKPTIVAEEDLARAAELQVHELDSLPCALGQNTEGKQQVLGS